MVVVTVSAGTAPLGALSFLATCTFFLDPADESELEEEDEDEDEEEESEGLGEGAFRLTPATGRA